MNDAQVGSIFRAVRIRRDLTQDQVATAAGVGRTTVSALERGSLEAVTLPLIRRVARTLGISLTLDARWRGAETAKLLDERHALLVRAVAARLREQGWTVRVEYTFSFWGEHGSIDVLAWQPISRAVAAVEVKTRLVDLQDLLSTTDRKARLLHEICRSERWQPLAFGSVLVLPDESWARKAVHRFEAIFATAFPSGTVAVKRWMARPVGPLGGVLFLSIAGRSDARRKPGGPMRVRPVRDGRVRISASVAKRQWTATGAQRPARGSGFPDSVAGGDVERGIGLFVEIATPRPAMSGNRGARSR